MPAHAILLTHRRWISAGQPDQCLFALLQVRPPVPPGGPRAPLDVVFVVDGSGSMAGARRRLVVEGLARTLGADVIGPGDRIAMVGFSDHVRTRLSLTDVARPGAIANALACVTTALGPTRLDVGLREALVLFGAGHRRRQVVLLTDGQTERPEAAREAARALGRRQVPITAIGIGNDWNEALLVAIADDSGGRPYHLVDDGAPAPPPSVPLTALPTVLGTELDRAARLGDALHMLAVAPAAGVALVRATRVFPTVVEVPLSASALDLGRLELGITTSFLLELALPAPATGPVVAAELRLFVGDAACWAGRVTAEAVARPEALHLEPIVMRAVYQRNLDATVERAAEAARRDPAEARRLLAHARDLTVRLGNDVMGAVVAGADAGLAGTGAMVPGALKRLRIGGRTQTVALGGDADLPDEAEIRALTGL